MADMPASKRPSQRLKWGGNSIGTATSEKTVLCEQSFKATIAKERIRTERSGKPFLLMLIDADHANSTNHNGSVLSNIVSGVSRITRETDVIGWYRPRSIFGVIFTEITEQRTSLLEIILKRMVAVLQDLGNEQINQIRFSFYLYPEDWDNEGDLRPCDPVLYPDIEKIDISRKMSQNIKRMVDVLGSILALFMASPLFLVIALAVKCSSKGPILFRQPRVGHYGKVFTLLKFRSMRVNNDDRSHRAYVTQLIAGKAQKQTSPRQNGSGSGPAVYKLTEDDRITWVGSWLRKSSMDELPQLLNVLKGDMSLVGPRPPLRYEVAAYKLWHRGRLLKAKPGITGLWQVSGRNLVKFNDMVRLDLAYATNWSLWLDIKILLRTPRAVLEGAH